MEKRYEENAYVLDFLPHGRAGIRPGYRAGAVIQVIGEAFFTLLEAIVKEGLVLKPYDRVYVGKGIYADVQLRLHKKIYAENEWTYPDYRLPWIKSFFKENRNSYLNELEQVPESDYD